MLRSFWDYLRDAACDAVLAGVEDAARILDQGRSPAGIVDASDHLRERLRKTAAAQLAGQDKGNPDTTGPAAPSPKATVGTETKTSTGKPSTDSLSPTSLFDTEAGHLSRPEANNSKPKADNHSNRGRKKVFKPSK